jgi:hypothetical protein
VLAFFRSQHSNESWLSTITTMLDSCALLNSVIESDLAFQAQLTFAIARHAVVDLAQIFATAPRVQASPRLAPWQLTQMRDVLSAAGHRWLGQPEAYEKLAKLRGEYEPYVAAMAEYFRLAIPAWVAESKRPDNWQTSAWKVTPAEVEAQEGHL